MMKFINLYIVTLISWIFVYIIGKILFNQPKRKMAIKDIFLLSTFALFTAIINSFNSEAFRGVFKILSSYCLFCLYFKISYRVPCAKNMLASLILYLCIAVSEVIIVLFASFILSFFHLPPSLLKNTILMDFIIMNFTLIIISRFRRVLVEFLKNKYTSKIYLNLIAIILLMMAIILFRNPVSKWVFNTEFIFTMITLLGFCILVLYLLKQRSDIERTTSMYQHVVEYSNTTNKVLEDYRIIGHEHKNQLSIIRQMISKDNAEAMEYIDSLIEKRNDIKYKWVSELNKLPLEGLKGLINYKLIEAEEKGIKISVIISKEVSKVKLNKLSTIEKDHLYSIGGVYLDNAIQAASKSKTKEINIEIYKENKELVFILANTFSGIIELDKIDDYGYSTKGKNHGIGLHIVKNIIDEDDLYSQSRKIIDNYYVQELRINIGKLNKKKK